MATTNTPPPAGFRYFETISGRTGDVRIYCQVGTERFGFWTRYGTWIELASRESILSAAASIVR